MVSTSPHVRRGFSLIEIVIVIMIIGVLAAATFGGLRYLQRVKLHNTNSKLAALDSFIESYHTQINEYPKDLQELITGPTDPKLKRAWGESTVVQVDLEDSWNQPFVYTLNPKGTRPPYDLYSIGSKGDAQIRSPKAKE